MLKTTRLAIAFFWLHVGLGSTSDITWDFEPRFWAHEDEIAESEHENSWPEDSEDERVEWSTESYGKVNSDPHESHYFLTEDSSGSRLRQGPTGGCDQFQVDIREAVICDKKRCDKLDFDWPTYDNQLSLVQTTRHGMRFHRVELAFAREDRVQVTDKATEESRVKLDLLEQIFKLKPKPSPTTSSTTTTTTTTENPPQNTETNGDTTTKPSEENDSDPKDDDSVFDRNKFIPTLRLDTSIRRRKQKIIGFGGALSDSSCRNIKSLSSEMAKSLMEDYFGSRGLRFNLARLTMGSSDFSTSPYTNNDVETRKSSKVHFNTTARLHSTGESTRADDVEMRNFRLTSEDLEFKLPVVRQAIATSRDRELKLFASLWSPPVWMKNNSHIVHGYLKGDVYGPYYKGLAELMLKWLEAYRQNGIEFWGLTGLNEPITGVKPFIFHNSLGITKDDYLTFIKLYLGPMLRQRDFKHVKLIMLDDNKGYVPNYVKSAMKDAQLARFISGVAYHWYMNDEYENLDFIERDFPDKFLLSSEACNGYLPFQVHVLPGDWDRGVAYLLDMIKSIQHNSAAWVDWNMALDLSGGPSWAKNNLDAAVIVNSRLDEYYKSPTFYALGHLSHFVEPGSVRLEQRFAFARFDYPLESVAFLTPKNYVVIVVLNANYGSIPMKIIVNRRLIRVVTLKGQSFNTIIFKEPNGTGTRLRSADPDKS